MEEGGTIDQIFHITFPSAEESYICRSLEIETKLIFKLVMELAAIVVELVQTE